MDDLNVPDTAFGYHSNLRSDGQRLFYLGSSASDFTCQWHWIPARAVPRCCAIARSDGRIFGFQPADTIEPVIIENLSPLTAGAWGR
jgi:hypothetical protein